MEEKRMFSKKIIDTDWFMDMPASSQNLYFHLSMRADDDGFVASPKRIIKLIGATDDDYRILISKKFIIPFESGICVITDWRINNYLRNDRYTETVYKQEKQSLTVDENGKYNIGIPTVDQVLYLSNTNSDTNSNTNKDGVVGEEKKEKHKYGEYNHILLTDDELSKLNAEYGEEKTQKAITYLDEYIEMKGTKYKSHYLALKKWVFEALEEKADKSKKSANHTNREYTQKQYSEMFTNIEEIDI